MGEEITRRPEEHLRLRRRSALDWGDRWAPLAAVLGIAGLATGFGAPGWVLSATAVAYLAVVFARSVAREDSHRETVEPIFELIDHGELAIAEARLEEMAKQATSPMHRAGTIAMVGWLRVRQQRFHGALTVFREVIDGVGSMATQRTTARTESAEALALLGRLDEADALARKTYDARRFAPASLAVVWCRLGKLDKVLTLKKTRVESSLRKHMGHTERKLSLMKAFASAKLGRQDARKHHTAAQPAFEGEYDYLTDNWPELKRFVDAHAWDGLRAPEAALPRARVVER